MAWTIQDYPFALPAAVYSSVQAGNTALVPADGSAEVTVPFTTAFLSSVAGVTATPSLDSTDSTAVLTANVDQASIGLTSFKVKVSGGPLGSTCTLNWQAAGT